VRVRVVVPVGMLGGVQVIVVRGRARDDLDAALLDPAHRQHPVGDRLQPIRSPVHDDHLQAQILTQVHVQRRPDCLT
jgi:hypothetical protein